MEKQKTKVAAVEKVEAAVVQNMDAAETAVEIGRDEYGRTIVAVPNFDLAQIAASGQCFRMEPVGPVFCLVARGRYVELAQAGPGRVVFSCDEEEVRTVWADYFDLGFDYGAVVRQLEKGADPFLREAAAFGHGIRILRQEPFETLVSFLISQNKNIPAIKRSIDALCRGFGERSTGFGFDGRPVEFYSFPTPEALAETSLDELRATGVGYRDAYLQSAARAVASGTIDLEALRDLPGPETIRALLAFHGVGEKVAHCVALFAYHHLDSCPVDVWIARVLDQVYGGRFDWSCHGGVCGLVQQYMFYYIRNGYSSK